MRRIEKGGGNAFCLLLRTWCPPESGSRGGSSTSRSSSTKLEKRGSGSSSLSGSGKSRMPRNALLALPPSRSLVKGRASIHLYMLVVVMVIRRVLCQIMRIPYCIAHGMS